MRLSNNRLTAALAALALVVPASPGATAPAAAQPASSQQGTASRAVALGRTPGAAARPVATPAAAPGPAIPSAAEMLVLIRGTLTALDQANATGNYYLFAALASEGFKHSNTTFTIARAFEPYRSGGISFGAVLVLDPEMMQPPAIESGELHLAGYFPSQPQQIAFDLRYREEDGKWRLSGINIQMMQARSPGSPPPRRTPAPVGR